MANPKAVAQPYIAPPLKGLIHIIAKAVVEDYRQELSKKDLENESSSLRTIQQR
ncbi:MAG: hypothetical protein SFX19_09960 [Alphaproteobacteria bacterium]|nr:hypothetical protein [Alphaproteobacteria bacterium]